jgi:hypothetical protein
VGLGDDGHFEPLEGGVKIVFDVLEGQVESITRTVRAAGFDVQRYYRPAHEHQLGGSAAGFIRLGAERAMTRFTEAEQRAIVAEFDAVQSAAGFECRRAGTDTWQAGNADGHGHLPL